MYQILDLLHYIIHLVNIVLLFRVYRSQVYSVKVFTWYIFAMGITQLWATILSKMHSNNLYLSHVYFITQFLFLSLYFYRVLIDPKIKKGIRITTLLLLSIVVGQYVIYPELFWEFNLVEIYLMSMPIIIYATMHLYQMLDQPKVNYNFTLGPLIYLIGSMSLFLFNFLMTQLHIKYPADVIMWFNIILFLGYHLILFTQIIQLKKTNTCN
ncbi:MAG: hypothetical protein RLZZ500_2505 [Bacteroidota bacterium]|jgi:hypothetical protein